MKNILFFLLLPFILISQEDQIFIDGIFNDWNNINNYNDDVETIENGTDFTNISVTNDSDYLYIKFETSGEIDLSDGDYNIELMIDTDNNNLTGYQPSFNTNIGVEIGIMFNQKFIWYNTPEANLQLSLYDIGVYPAPTVTSNEFEIAIDLNAQYNGVSLFQNSELKIQMRDLDSEDNIPNNNSEIIYNINPISSNDTNININKDYSQLIRLTAYNLWNDGFEDAERLPQLKSILQTLDSDIFAFSECWDTNEETVKNILDVVIPLENNNGWMVIKKENDDLIIASKYPIIEQWNNEENGIQNMQPCLIDLPDDIYAKDLLIINSHMSCCSKDSLRQIQADNFVNFILDAKSEGGVIDLVEGTPFVLCGDLNLVGFSQQITTLLTGEIINTDVFGSGGGMNWSNNNLKDQICFNTSSPLSYTWRDLTPSTGSYPYGRLDFIIFSDDVMSAQKSFSLDTQKMTQGQLNSNNLDNYDSVASDHLAITTDFAIPLILSGQKEYHWFKKILNKINFIGQNTKQKNLTLEVYDDGSTLKKYIIE